MRYSLMTAALACLAVAACCPNRDRDRDDDYGPEPTRPAASTASPTPEKPATLVAPAQVQIAEQASTQSFTPDKERWLKPFKFGLPSGAMAGQSWTDARASCLSVGKDLCTQDQWLQACNQEATVGTAPSWTISPSSEKGSFIVRGGSGCASTAAAPYATGATGRIGLCCEKGAAISSTKKSEAWLKSADVYARMVEDALNSPNPEAITKLLDEQAKVFATTASKEQALKNLRDDYKRYSEWKHRFVRCDADIDTYTGTFECDTVMTRTMSSGTKEMTVFRARFEYGEPRLTYKVFASTSKILWPWAPVQ